MEVAAWLCVNRWSHRGMVVCTGRLEGLSHGAA